MITKTRPIETVEELVKQERHIDWENIVQGIVNIFVAVSALYVLHVTYIHVWRMMTGH
jgi:hypothetical protein